MKKHIVLLSVTLLLALSSCLKKEDLPPEHDAIAQLAKDTLQIRKFLDDKFIDATKLGPTGIYYKIITPGTGTVLPVAKSKITVKYKGRFLNGAIFDESKNDSVVFILNEVIPAWQIGIPLIKKGGKMRLITSSGYAYEQYGLGSVIPPNANLDFDIELLDVK